MRYFRKDVAKRMKLKKRTIREMKHLVIILGILMVLLSGPMSVAANEISVSTTDTHMNITVSLDSRYQGKAVGLEVVKPRKSITDIGDTQSDVLSVLEFVGQENISDDGKAYFTVAPSGEDAGYYTIYVNVKGGEIFKHTVAFAPKIVVDTLITSLEAVDTTEADIAKIFKKPIDSEELAGYAILGFGELPEFEIYQNDVYGQNEKRNRIHKELRYLLAGKDYDKTQVQEQFVDSVYRSVIYTLDDVAELIQFLEQYPEKTGLTSAKLYETVYKNTEYIGSAAKKDIAEMLIEIPWTDSKTGIAADGYATKADIVNEIDKAIFMGAIQNISDGYGKIGELITLGKDILIANGANFDSYNKADSKKVWQAVSNADSFENFVSKFNVAVRESTENKPSKPSSSSGSGGSSSIVQLPSVQQNNPPIEVKKSFDDIETVTWAKEAIEELYEKGLISGKSEGKFCPNDNMTRAEFVKVILLCLNLHDTQAQADFKDVEKNSWCYSYVASAYQLGIVNGYGDIFGINDTITREDAATILLRCVGVVGGELPEIRESANFKDFDDVSSYAKISVDALYKAGVINGMSETEFAPQENITRAQAIKMIHSLLKIVSQEG